MPFLPNSEERKTPHSEFLRKSKKGLWVRGQIVTNDIIVYYHSRHEYRKDRFVKIGPDNEVISEIEPTRLSYDEPWIEIGRIGTNNPDLLKICDMDKYDWLLYGMMRHAVQLIASGWGDKAELVLDWFDDILEGKFVVPECEYVLLGPFFPPFYNELEGCSLVDARYQDKEFSATIIVPGVNKIPFSDDKVKTLGAFLISVVPA